MEKDMAANVLKMAVVVALASVGLVANAATYTTTALPELNGDIRTWTDGGAYAGLFPSSQVFSGVPFSLQESGGNDVFVGVGSTTIKVGVFGVTDVYTLINTAWGTAGANVGSITFNGSMDSYTVNLIEGDNVRDHYYASYVNSTTASYVTQAVVGINAPGNSHLDMQDFVLPTSFQSQTLNSIVFNSTGGGAGSPFLAGLTVAAVPEPETYAMLLAGLGLLSVCARRKAGASR
jgi:hypothetical protein